LQPIRQQNAEQRGQGDYVPSEQEKQLNKEIGQLEFAIKRTKEEGRDVSELEQKLKDKLLEKRNLERR